jgi:hypothetical protein
MDTLSVRTIKNNCYCDIAQGSILVLMFAALQLSMWGVDLGISAIASVIPPAPIYESLAPITSGDLLLITLITGYGAIWGLRLISSAIGKLRSIPSDGSQFVNSPHTV